MSDEFPKGYALFCDDVRHEVSGKRSFIGVYSDYCYLNAEFPVTLSQLVVVVTLLDRIDPDRKAITLQVHLPGDPEDKPSASADVPFEALEENIGKTNVLGEPVSRISIRSEFNFSPITFKAPGKMVVSAVCEGERMELGTLIVAQPPAPEETTEDASAHT